MTRGRVRRSRRGNVGVRERYNLSEVIGDVPRARRAVARMLLLRALRAYVRAPQYLSRYCWASLLLVLRAAFTARDPVLYTGVCEYLRSLVRASGLPRYLRGDAWRALLDAVPSLFGR